MDRSIMPECYADTLFIETLVPPKMGYNHKHSCFKVESEMRFGKLKDQFAVGIIDNDKKQITYLDEFAKIDSIDGSLLLWKHNNRAHVIIQICPAFEKWIMSICKSAKIDLVKHGLKDDLGAFMKLTKAESSLDNKSLGNLFVEICERQDIEDVNRLRKWLRVLIEKNYQLDLKEIING